MTPMGRREKTWNISVGAVTERDHLEDVVTDRR